MLGKTIDVVYFPAAYIEPSGMMKAYSAWRNFLGSYEI